EFIGSDYRNVSSGKVFISLPGELSVGIRFPDSGRLAIVKVECPRASRGSIFEFLLCQPDTLFIEFFNGPVLVVKRDLFLNLDGSIRIVFEIGAGLLSPFVVEPMADASIRIISCIGSVKFALCESAFNEQRAIAIVTSESPMLGAILHG